MTRRSNHHEVDVHDDTVHDDDATPSRGERMTTTRRAQPRRGFTLIEILIVVIILGILAAIVMPQFSTASTEARLSTMKEELRFLRTQVQAFKLQHLDTPPGFPNGDTTADPTEAVFTAQLTQYSDETGATRAAATPTYRYGPYLSALPTNPFNGRSGVWVVTGTTMPAADASKPCGWIYNATTERVAPNLPGNDPTGVPFASY
ncbi:MAG TPA: prepilin-type N-terminal cleavage/methylation domain-containing protein [Humisphaera sp.]